MGENEMQLLITRESFIVNISIFLKALALRSSGWRK